MTLDMKISQSTFCGRMLMAFTMLWSLLSGIKQKKVFYVSTVETFGTWIEDRNIKEEDMGHFRI